YIYPPSLHDALPIFAKLWKNGIPQDLTNGSNQAESYSVFVSGNDVYAVGQERIGSKDVAKLWKNGVAQNLTDGINHAKAKSVYVSGNDVYIVGQEHNGSVH